MRDDAPIEDLVTQMLSGGGAPDAPHAAAPGASDVASGFSRTGAPDAAPAPSVEEDVAALATDPELAGMFIAEALDHLGTIESNLLLLEASPGDAALLNDIFRPFHTIKGNAGALGVRTVQEVAHKAEELLDRVRSGRHRLGVVEIDVVLRAVDLLTTLISDLSLRVHGHEGRSLEIERAAVMRDVDRLLSGDTATPFASGVAVRMARDVSAPAAPSIDGGACAAPLPNVLAAIKVDTRKLDNLVDMVGELVIVQAIIEQNATLLDPRLARHLALLKRISGDLQRNATSLRMVPIRQTFQKMARIVRELSRAFGKHVDLIVHGEETEIDRQMVEDLSDPLTHMIRNSLDHGIERPDARAAAGKPAHARIVLGAGHESGNIRISIGDDGAGLNTEKILAKAVSQGLVPAGARPAPADIHGLIFHPGFSTADAVTEISGRGVGMDVVKRNIERLRGRIEIQSTPGCGTTFVIKLPLTLAIVEGLVLSAGTERFVLPTFAIRESLRPRPAQVHAVQGRARMIQVRQSLLPMVSLAEAFGIRGAEADPCQATVVIIENDGRRAALVVDQLLGKQEVVVKPLGETFARVRGVSGGAILGDGRIGLILDAGGLIDLMQDPVAA